MQEVARESNRSPEKEAAILREALWEFAARGYRAADVQGVADRAGVGKGTIYRYYESKEGLFRAVAHAGMQELERRFHELLEADLPFLELARRMVGLYAAHFQAHPEYVQIMIQERAEFRSSTPDTHQLYRGRNQDRLDALLQTAVDDGTIRPVDVRRTVNAIGDALYGTVVRGVIEGRGAQLTSDAEYMLDLFLDGIRA